MSWDAADRSAADAIAACHRKHRRPILVGLAGAQGSGKSTMAPRLAALLEGRGLAAATLALDDFYLTRAERTALSRMVHPLLATRGAPGTHDVALLAATLDGLLRGKGARVPQFDKASDDRTGMIDADHRCDVALLEGWCIGARPQPPARLVDPVNALERREDPDGRWRVWVNDRLAGDYAALWARLDLRLYLRAPSFRVVARWRGEQEAHLGERAMAPASLDRFIAHYERITRWMLDDEPADLVFDLDPHRVPTGAARPAK